MALPNSIALAPSAIACPIDKTVFSGYLALAPL